MDNNGYRKNKIVALSGLLLVVIFLFILDKTLAGFWRTLLMLFGINIILAVSLTITNSWINFFSIGHGGIILAGAYVAAFLTLPPEFKNGIIKLRLPEIILNMQWSMLPALLIGSAFGALVAVLLALPALRLKSFYFCAGSLGFGVIVTNIAESIPSITNGPPGLWQFPPYTNIWWVWGLAILSVYIALVLKKSYLGRALITIGKDQDLAEHMGINLLKYKVIAFGLSGFIATTGGILWIHLIRNLSPNSFNMSYIFEVVAMIVIGGMGSISGAVIGAGIITLFLEVMAPLEEGFSVLGIQVPQILGLTTIMLGVLLILVLIKKPQGFMGEKEFTLRTLGLMRKR